VATTRVETAREVADLIHGVLRWVAPGRLYPCTNCGMAPLGRETALAKLAALGQGAALARAELGVPR
jgi:5-methyltetrahydropteroyltriglutamate--homocysteine methyltransferase